MGTEPLVLVPGLMCDRALWEPLLPGLGEGVRCIVVDHGNADRLETMAHRLLETAPPRFALAGHSMGGRVVLEVMRLAPERVVRMALLDTGYRARAAGAAGEAELHKRMQLLQLARSQGVRAMASTWVQDMVDPARLGDAELIESIVSMFERKSADVFEAQIRALLARPDATSVLATIAVPALVLCGRHDSWAPVPQHQEIVDRIPHARFEIVEGAGHMSTMERPAEVTAALRRWLDAPGAAHGQR
jgi:pimeloyl-ACP methyl ester carboxylesterase